ncbi:hypothetical protein LQ327_31030 [Actinomycetospora endophytica]|uniref:Uncharacterized protein n=1 Tax=Actinomycetospora endophytica TaxID=2291215 RepID=A0ABS8PHU1_9PSEU|nr:hypothetical protein [Actinomycetospora endophytica]MCD2197815.1 hypothetical protein [Actinomycetospora endophytica]
MRPWVLRALVMTLLYGVGQTLFVALSSRVVDQTLLWSILLLGSLLLVGLVWGGAEVITDRVPPEWTWLKAAFAAGPAAGLLTWALLALFVDAVGIEDLSSALIGRASFTVLLILVSASLGSRLGWLSLRRSDDPRAASDPTADTDEPGSEVPTTRLGGSAAPALAASTFERVEARRARRLEEQAAGTRPATSGAPPSSRLVGSADRGDDPTRVPFGSGPFADPPGSPEQSSPEPASAGGSGGYASPVVAVLPPVTPLPAETEPSSGSASSAPSSSDASSSEPEDVGADEGADGRRPGASRRRFGLRRPGDDD